MWEIKETNIFQDWFLSLTDEKAALITRKILTLKRLGNNATIKQGSKSLGKSLFELRDKNMGLRAYYTFKGNKLIMLLNGGDKNTKKQQAKDIKLARKLLSELE